MTTTGYSTLNGVEKTSGVRTQNTSKQSVGRVLSVDEALPYSPFSSVVPFNSGIYISGAIYNILTTSQTLYRCLQSVFSLLSRYTPMMMNDGKHRRIWMLFKRMRDTDQQPLRSCRKHWMSWRICSNLRVCHNCENLLWSSKQANTDRF